MIYLLVYCSRLNIFALEYPDFHGCPIRKTFTEAELRKQFVDNATLTRYLEFALSNPDKECVYDMLPA